MKFRCERDVIVDALGIAGRAVSGRGGMPGLSGVRAHLVGDTLTLTGSDLDLTISISTTVAGDVDGVAVVPARLSTEIVKSLPAGAVSFETNDESMTISAGRSEFTIRLIAGDEFPIISGVGSESVSLPADQLAEALKQVVGAASSDESRPILTGVSLSAETTGLRLAATDSFRMAMRDVPGVAVLSEGQSVLIPSRALGELNRILGQGDKVELNLAEREASFVVGDVRLVTRLIEGDYPNVAGLIPATHANVLTVGRAALIDALKRVKLLARESTPIRLQLSQGSVELVAVTLDVGTARESVEATYEGSDLTVAFNPDFLMEGVDVAGGDEITLHTIDEQKPAVIRSTEADDFVYLIMPVRVS